MRVNGLIRKNLMNMLTDTMQYLKHQPEQMFMELLETMMLDFIISIINFFNSVI